MTQPFSNQAACERAELQNQRGRDLMFRCKGCWENMKGCEPNTVHRWPIDDNINRMSNDVNTVAYLSHRFGVIQALYGVAVVLFNSILIKGVIKWQAEQDSLHLLQIEWSQGSRNIFYMTNLSKHFSNIRCKRLLFSQALEQWWFSPLEGIIQKLKTQACR